MLFTDLAKQILGEVFTPAFLTPIEDTDRVFRLEVCLVWYIVVQDILIWILVCTVMYESMCGVWM